MSMVTWILIVFAVLEVTGVAVAIWQYRIAPLADGNDVVIRK